VNVGGKKKKAQGRGPEPARKSSGEKNLGKKGTVVVPKRRLGGGKKPLNLTKKGSCPRKTDGPIKPPRGAKGGGEKRDPMDFSPRQTMRTRKRWRRLGGKKAQMLLLGRKREILGKRGNRGKRAKGLGVLFVSESLQREKKEREEGGGNGGE